MRLAPILAYTLLPLATMLGGLAMMFSSFAPQGLQPALIGLGGLAMVVAPGLLCLTMTLQHVETQKPRLRDERG
jgi:hypothetical protein